MLEGDRRVFVNEPASGQKLELGYFKDKTTVGELRHKLRMLLLHRGRDRYANGCGFEVESGELQWIRGPLLCGGVLLADDARTLTSYEVKGGFQGEPSVIFSVGSVGQLSPTPPLTPFHQISVSPADFARRAGEAVGAAVDPDLALEAVEQIKGTSSFVQLWQVVLALKSS